MASPSSSSSLSQCDSDAILRREALTEVHAAMASPDKDSDSAALHGTILRYGENPHQKGAFLGDMTRAVSIVAVNPSKPRLSYNNVLDVDSAIALMADFLADGPTVAVLKHGIPCALASAASMALAWQRALAVDPLSPFGGVAIFNAPLDAETAALVNGLYLDVVLAPDYEPGVVKMLPRKTLMKVNSWDLSTTNVRGALGGLLVHERDPPTDSQRADRITLALDHNDGGGKDHSDDGDDDGNDDHHHSRCWKVVTRTKPNLDQTLDLLYAERACKHVKSNAVVLVKDRRMIAAGAAQPCRVGAVEVALMRAQNYPTPRLDLTGMVMASDAYFPFPDGPTKAIAGGVVAIVQPGGSRNGDAPSIAACDEAGVAMVFTGVRHFRH